MYQQPFDWSPLVFHHHTQRVEAGALRRRDGARAGRRTVRPPRLPEWLAGLPLVLLVTIFLLSSGLGASPRGVSTVAGVGNGSIVSGAHATFGQVTPSWAPTNSYIGSPS